MTLVISLGNCAIYVHPDLKIICVSNPHVELARRVLFSQGGLSPKTREAAICGECLDWEG